MGIMDRLSRLLRANVNEMLDRAEDPEKMLDQMLRDMETNISAARSHVPVMTAQENELEAHLREVRELPVGWWVNATRAVEAGKDPLALEARLCLKDHDETATI